MKTVMIVIACATMCLVACKKGGGGGGGGGDYSAIEKQVATAKSSMDFIKIKTSCMMIVSKNKDAAKDAAYQKACRIGPAKARAKVALAEAKAGKKNNSHCTFVGMSIDKNIKDGIAVDEMKKLKAELDKGCK